MNLPTPNTDPGGLYGAVITLLGAVLALAVGFGAALTEQQIALILGVATAAGPLVTAFMIRRKAWAPATVQQEIDAVADMTAHDDQDGTVDLQAILWLLVAVLLALIIVRLA